MNNASKPRVVILCGDDSHHRYLIARLASSQDVALAVVESSAGAIRRLAKARRYKQLCTHVYHRMRRAVSGTAGYRRRYFSVDELPVASVPVLKVDSINDSAVPLSIKRYAPDIIIVMGTSILKKDVLEAAGNIPIVNIHGGCLPDYKGNHCFFFALLNEDFSKIATTIHLIDSGIDSGSVICRIHPTIYRYDNAEMLYCRAEKDAITELDALITKYGVGIADLAVPQPERGHLYYTKDRTLACEAKMRKIRHRMKRNGRDVICEQHIDYS